MRSFEVAVYFILCFLSGTSYVLFSVSEYGVAEVS